MTNPGTTVCIAGGGPAGVMLGYLLARAGVDVTVLEKHADFFRDFRGDTIHPSTLQLMHELGVLDEFLKLPHQKAPKIGARFGDLDFTFADFSHLPTVAKYIAFMPQWDFLNFLAERGRRYPHFRLVMNAEATGLIWDGDRIAGVTARTPDGPMETRARLTVACDGRNSILREKAALDIDELGAPMDVLWFALSRKPSDAAETMGVFAAGRIFVLIDRGHYWQCAFVIPKGSMDETRAQGIEAFRNEIARVEPMLADRVGELDAWDKVHLLTVAVNRVRKWHRPGFLCIGDAAHAMSPVGGVGVNLAVQDAVAAANALAMPLWRGEDPDPLLRQVQERREWPTRVTQRLQLVVQNRVIGNVLRSRGALEPPFPVRMLARFPWLQRIPARLVGMGVLPEHIGTRERAPQTAPTDRNSTS